MESHHDNQEKTAEKMSPTESVDTLITEKESERKAEGQRVVMEQAEGVQSEVADVMAGMEGPKEKVSERAGERGDRRDISGGGAPATDDKQALQSMVSGMRKSLPSHEIMIKKVRTAIQIQIKQEMKKAKKLQKNLSSGSAQEYNTTIARIRRLKETLQSLLQMTFESLKSTYQKYFTAEGRRKSMDEV